MRRLRYAVAASLDGFIAGPKGEADWIPADPDIDFAALWAEFDTLLMGRRTFETMPPGSGGSDGPTVLVVSRTLRPDQHRNVTIIGRDLAREVAALKDGPGKDIWLFGGGQLFKSCLSLGLVDSVEVAVVPVLLGGGVPLLPAGGPRSMLELVKQRTYSKSGIVSLEYAISRTAH